MEKNIIIASAITAGAAALLYLAFKLSNRNTPEVVQQPVARPKRHLTDVFSKAK